MSKSRRNVTRRGRPVLKPRGYVRSNRAVKTFDALPKIHKHTQGIAHNGIARGHTAVFDTGIQQLMIGRDIWEIIKCHDTWIDVQGVNMGGPPKSGRRLQLVDARGVVKNLLGGKPYLVILRQDFFNPNSDKTLLTEDQIKCYGVKVYSPPRVFGGKQLVEDRDQVGRSVKLGKSWYVSTRYLNVILPTRDDVERLGSLQLTCRELYSPYSPFRRTTSKFKLY